MSRLTFGRRRRRAVLPKERCAAGELAQLDILKQANRAVHAIVAGVSNHLLLPQPRDRLGDERRRGRRDVFQRKRVEKLKLRSELTQKALVVLGDPLALRADLMDFGQDLGKRNKALHRARGLGRGSFLGPVRQILDPVHDPDRQRLAARRAPAFMLAGLAGREADMAVAVSVHMILALFGKELQRAFIPLPRLQCPAQGKVVQLGVEDAHFPPQLLW